nr:hypothetical protein CFP56_41510 [Quercus suber]
MCHRSSSLQYRSGALPHSIYLPERHAVPICSSACCERSSSRETDRPTRLANHRHTSNDAIGSAADVLRLLLCTWSASVGAVGKTAAKLSRTTLTSTKENQRLLLCTWSASVGAVGKTAAKLSRTTLTSTKENQRRL